MEDAKPGDPVEFQDLKGAAHLNGTRGHLIRFLDDHQRWAVRVVESWKVFNAKPANLKLIKNSESSSKEIYKITNPITGEIQYMKPNTTSNPIPSPTNLLNNLESLRQATLDAFYKDRKGGVVISCGDKFMIAIEFDGPFNDTGVMGEMVFVDRDRRAQAVVRDRGCARAGELGRNFLTGETIKYIDTTNEDDFFRLLFRYKLNCSTQGYIDIKSGLRLFKIKIPK